MAEHHHRKYYERAGMFIQSFTVYFDHIFIWYKTNWNSLIYKVLLSFFVILDGYEYTELELDAYHVPFMARNKCVNLYVPYK